MEFFEDDHESRDAAESRSDGRWGRKSLRKDRSYRISTGLKQNDNFKLTPQKNDLCTIEQGNSESSESCLSLKDEQVVVGHDSLDGIELNMKASGMELLHVLGTNVGDGNQAPIERRPTCPVNFAQFSTNFHPLCIPTSQHRVSLNSLPKSKPTFHSPKDVLSILEGYDPFDEESAIEEELKKTNAEIKALECDLELIDAKLERGSCYWLTSRCNNQNCQSTWNIDVLLDDEADFDESMYGIVKGVKHQTTKENYREKESIPSPLALGWDERRALQKKRGYLLLASFEDALTGEVFSKKCGGTQSSQPVHVCLKHDSEFFNVKKVAANAGAVRHFTITKGQLGLSFFLSKDDGRAYQDDNLPSRLRAGIAARGSDLQPNTIRYLACGPNESYFAQLMSGECLWGISQPDEEFKMVMSSFHVHRVAFGPFLTNENNVETSWIIIGSSGQLAWRNLPCRLHELLSKRDETMAGACEVSLGFEGSYFIKFLDGEIDYCLPDHIGSVCEKIIEQGGAITNIALHPESSKPFIIRHTMLP